MIVFRAHSPHNMTKNYHVMWTMFPFKIFNMSLFRPTMDSSGKRYQFTIEGVFLIELLGKL